MIDMFLKVAYEHSVREQQNADTISLLQKLPVEELAKLARGEKTAGLCEAKSASGENCYLDQFKGSPLFEQAIALEQAELQAEMQDISQRQQRRTENNDNLWEVKDQIRVQKKLLELELAKSQNGSPAPEAPAQGAGAMGDVPPEGVTDAGASGAVGAKMAASLTLFADGVGREMAQSDMRKAAGIERAHALGDAVGRMMAKRAGVMGSIGSHLSEVPNDVRNLGQNFQKMRGLASELHGGGEWLPGGGAFQSGLEAAHAAAQQQVARGAGAVGGAGLLGLGGTAALLHHGQAPAPAAPLMKQAFGMNEVRGLGTAAMGMARANPGAAGALAGGALGAAGGAVAGGPNHRLGGAVAGGTLGAGAGAMGGGIARRMEMGQGFGQAASATGRNYAARAQGAMQKVWPGGAKPGGGGAMVAGAPPARPEWMTNRYQTG